ncbi:MAG: hybrid sensor histidine kinase/response regulator [Oscillatoria sp. PMC 1068.18]|nr:hybrid sensor histidine kinase/response regulator [Oscillatoria sp. PMC 1076.18]MEC4987263.1 hybrid sensor histidine kinase/response regulator [Oscillatoria sp. PMC 1068.18]
MIEDEELRNLYQVASEEHLQKLNNGLLYLETHLEDKTPFEELLREAHSLKGDSRMLGVNDVETLTHQIEHILGTIYRSEIELSPEVSEILYAGLDNLAKLVREAVTGEPSGVNTFQALAHLMGASTASNEGENMSKTEEKIEPESIYSTEREIEIETKIEAEIEPESSYLNEEKIKLDTELMSQDLEEIRDNSTENTNGKFPIPSSQSPVPNSQFEPYRIETIRVETRYLDALMTETGELTVTKIRIAHQIAQIEEIAALWSEIQSKKAKKSQIIDLDLVTQKIEQRLEASLKQLLSSAQENVARLDLISTDLEEKVRTLRLLPLANIFNLYPRTVRDLAKEFGKEIELIIEGGETTADKRILEEMKDPLLHLIRNAIDHGIETPCDRQKLGKPPVAQLRLRGYQTANHIVIEVTDDGKGLDTQKIKETALHRGLYCSEELAAMTPNQIYALIFAPGFSTRTFITEVSGRGVGLDVVRHHVEQLKGNIEVESTPNQGTTFRMLLGKTLATAPVLLVEVDGITYGIPLEFVERNLLVFPEEIFTIAGKDAIALQDDEQAIPVVWLADLLEISPNSNQKKSSHQERLVCIILQVGKKQFGLFVDQLIDTQDVVLKPQSKFLKRVRNVAGATILGTGEVCIILNCIDLLKSVEKRSLSLANIEPKSTLTKSDKPIILLVEDSIAVRTQEKRILEAAGYQVITAVDGLDGYNKLRVSNFDAVISDVQMPNLDGLSLTTRIRQHQEYNELPIILVTSLATDEDKRKGAEAGANAYITKGDFNQQFLLETLKRLI